MFLIYNPAMSEKIEEYVVDAWIALLRAKDSSLAYVEKSLKDNGLPPFAWYDVLWELDKAGEAGLRPFEIEQQKLLSQYSLSRLLGRLEKAGYLVKTQCETDGRGHLVTITPQGREIREKMWAVYSREYRRQSVTGWMKSSVVSYGKYWGH